MPYPCSLSFSLSFLFRLPHLHNSIFISNVFCKNTALCIQTISSCILYFSPGPLMQKGIFLPCMCLHSQEFHCWHCHPMTSFLSEWGELPLKGIWRPPGCLDHHFSLLSCLECCQSLLCREICKLPTSSWEDLVWMGRMWESLLIIQLYGWSCSTSSFIIIIMISLSLPYHFQLN